MTAELLKWATYLPSASTIQEGAKAIIPTPNIFNHPTHTNPPFSPCFSTSHDDDSDPISPPTVNTAVTSE
jgi:hypothetical protein